MPPICKKTNKIVLFCTYSKGCGASLDQTLKFVRCPKHRKSSRISKRVYRCLEKGVDPVTSDEEAVEQRTRTLAEKVREKQHRTCDARRHRGSNSSRDDSSSVSCASARRANPGRAARDKAKVPAAQLSDEEEPASPPSNLQASPSAEVAPHVAAVAPVQFAPVNRLVPEFCPPTLTEDVTLALDARSLLHYWASTVHQAHQKPARAILKVLDGLVLSRPLDAIGWAYAALQLLGNEAVYFDPALVLSCDSSLSVAGAIAKRAMNVHSLEQLGRFCHMCGSLLPVSHISFPPPAAEEDDEDDEEEEQSPKPAPPTQPETVSFAAPCNLGARIPIPLTAMPYTSLAFPASAPCDAAAAIDPIAPRLPPAAVAVQPTDLDEYPLFEGLSESSEMQVLRF